MSTDWLSDKFIVERRLDHIIKVVVKDPNGDDEELYFSRRGFTSPQSAIIGSGEYQIPSGTLCYKRVVEAPVIKESLWGGGVMGGGSYPSASALKLANSDGGLDRYAERNGYVWKGAPIHYMVLDINDPAETIWRPFSGNVATAKFGIDSVSVTFSGKETTLNKNVSDKVFRGTGPWCLSLDGVSASPSTALVSCGNQSTAPNLNIQTDLTVEMWVQVIDFGSETEQPLIGWLPLSGNTSWQVGLRDDGSLSLVYSVSGSIQSQIFDVTIVAGVWYHICVTVEGTTATAYVFNDDTGESQTDAVTTTGATRDACTFAEFQIGRCVGTRQILIDEVRVWDFAKTADEVEQGRSRPVDTDIDVSSGAVSVWNVNDGAGTTLVDGKSGYDGTITLNVDGAYNWYRSGMGQSDLAGTFIPFCYGLFRGAVPVLVDEVNRIYRVSAEEIQSLIVYAGGAQVGSPTYTNSSSYLAFISSTPEAGSILTYRAMGLFKMGSAPQFPVLCTVEGLANTKYAAEAIRWLLENRGGLTYPADFDTDVFNGFDTDNPLQIGDQLMTQVTIGQVIDSIVKSYGGMWGWYKHDGRFTFAKFEGPVLGGKESAYEFDQRSIIRIEPRDIDTLTHTIKLRYRKINQVLSETEIAASILTSPLRYQWMSQWREITISSSQVLADYPPPASRPAVMDTVFYLRGNVRFIANAPTDISLDVGADDELVRRFAVFSRPAEAFDLVLTAEAATALLTSKCTIEYVDQRLVERLGLDGVNLYIIMERSLALQRGEVTLTVWGWVTQ